MWGRWEVELLARGWYGSLRQEQASDTAKLEFNPNKVGGERSLLWLLRQLWSRAKLREGCEVKQWDLACDWPEPREWVQPAQGCAAV